MSEKLKMAEEKYKKATDNVMDQYEKYDPLRVSADFITCRICKSKLNKEMLKTKYYADGHAIRSLNGIACPVCGNQTSLYSKTAVERISASIRKQKTAKKQLEKEKTKIVKKTEMTPFQEACERVENRLEVIYDISKTPDFVEYHGEIGGDLLNYRVYRDGMVVEK